MEQIKNFFRQIAGKIGDAAKMVKDKIFWKKAEADRQEKIRKGLVLGIIAAIIIILAAWLVIAKMAPKPVEKNISNQIAEAKLTIVTTHSCGKTCWDPQLFTDALASQGIKIDDKETVYVDSWWPFSSGKNLAAQYKITKVPTVIVAFAGSNQPDINKFFSPTLGTVVNGKFVLTKILAPYFDLGANKIKGIINVTYLTDQSCTQCYDVKKHETALKNLGASTANSQSVDISSPAGQDLVNKYKITKVPTVIVTGEVSEYTILTQAWSEVGTIAADGTYIFTNLDLMGDYFKDLVTGKIIKANPPAATATTPAATK